MNKFLIRGAALGAGILLMGSAAHATLLQVAITDGTNTLFVLDGGTGDTDSTFGEIVVDQASLLAMFPELAATSQVTAATNFGTTDDYRFVSSDNRLKGSASASLNKPIEIFASETDFVVPQTTTKELDSSFSGIFTNSGAGVGAVSQVSVDPANQYFGMGAGTTTNGFNGPYFSTSKKPNSFGGDLGPDFFSANTYSMTVESAYALAAGAVVQSSAIGVVTPVPEPATMTLLGLGVAAFLRRRRN